MNYSAFLNLSLCIHDMGVVTCSDSAVCVWCVGSTQQSGCLNPYPLALPLSAREHLPAPLPHPARGLFILGEHL